MLFCLGLHLYMKSGLRYVEKLGRPERAIWGILDGPTQATFSADFDYFFRFWDFGMVAAILHIKASDQKICI